MADMKQSILTISLIILLGACTDENYTGTLSSGGEPGELVPVELALNIQPVQSPLSLQSKADSHVISSTEVCKGMEISLVKTPVTRATDASEINNFEVFQFDGILPGSKLIWRQFINSNSVKGVSLMNSDVKNRIIVIANTGENTFDDLEEGRTTLAQFNDKAIAYNEGGKVFPPNFPLYDTSGGRIIFAGSVDMIVKDKKQADIMLYRTTARVKVNLSLSTGMPKEYTSWVCQFMHVPKKSYYHSTGRVAVFPTADVGYADYEPQLSNTAPPGRLMFFYRSTCKIRFHRRHRRCGSRMLRSTLPISRLRGCR